MLAIFSAILFMALLFVLVVTIHEFGHFLLARLNGVQVHAFACGFGPELFGYTDKRGTRWKFCAIPLGGYVKMETAKGAPASYSSKKVWQRASIIAAGPGINFLTAILVFAGLFYMTGKPVMEGSIGNIGLHSPAATAQLQKGDKLIRLNGIVIKQPSDYIIGFIKQGSKTPSQLEIERQGSRQTVKILPHFREKDQFPTIGAEVSFSYKGREFPGVFEAVGNGVSETYKTVTLNVQAIANIISGALSPKMMSSVIGMSAHIGGQVAEQVNEAQKDVGAGIEVSKAASSVMGNLLRYFAHIFAVLSVAIAFFNLLPILPLDGGHLVLQAVEALRGKEPSEKAQHAFGLLGVLLIGGLFIAIVAMDIVKLAT